VATPVSEEYARRLTWDEHLEEWLERYVVELLAEQRRSYAASLRRSVELHLRPRIGSKVMAETTVEDLKQLWRDLLSKRDGNLARSTVKNIRSALSIAAEDAAARHLIRGNPVRAAKLPIAHLDDIEADEARRQNTLSAEAAAWVASSAIAGVFGIWSGPTLIALDTGCRRGEALGLKWPNIDFNTGTIRFVRQVLQESSQNEPSFGRLKERQVRSVPATARCLEYLRRLHEAAGCPKDGLIFSDESGQMLHPDAWTQKWSRDFAVTYPQLAGTTIHDLRHTHATILLGDGESIPVVSERLGHATKSFTLDRYSHAIPGDSARVASRWERLT
jgi:integrase